MRGRITGDLEGEKNFMKKGKLSRSNKRENFQLHLMTLPAVVWFGLFCYLPLFGIFFAFKDFTPKPGRSLFYNLFVNSPWVGVRNFSYLFRNPQSLAILGNTLFYIIILTKRAFLTVLPVMVFICTFCGCKRQDQGEDGIRLRWVTYGGSVPADIKEVVKAANEYSAEKIGVTVDMELHPSEMLNLIMASGEYYDMVFTCEWLNSYDNNAISDQFYDITDLVQEETPRLCETIGDYWEAAEVNGRIYGVPTLKDMGTEMMFRLNADYFEGEKGMEIPEYMDFADIEPYLAAYKEDFPYKYRNLKLGNS